MVFSSGASPSRETPPLGRILAIDYGRRRIGLALSDALAVLPRPLATLVRTNRRNDLRRLREIVRENDVRRIIVGHPVHLDGTAGEMADEARRFAARIEKQLRLPVALVDERLTSWEAEQLTRSRGKARRQGGGEIDHVAAAVILRDYLERPGTGLEPARPKRKQAKG